MNKKKIRVQLDLSAGEVKALDELRSACGLRSRADAVRTALAVLEWIQAEARRGHSVVAVGDEDISHLVVPGLTSRIGGSS
ncbi:MAG: hypothetical protein ACE5GX_18940 [Thermoanaerobaculia bacterium]